MTFDPDPPPRIASRATAAASSTDTPPCAGRRRILVVDDNADAADTLADLLSLDGHEVRVAYSGPEALACAAQARPDVVLCDIGLPHMDGYAVARAFRAEPRLADVRLVAVTGYAGADDRRRAREAGFDHHVPKPPPHEVLERLLEDVPAHAP